MNKWGKLLILILVGLAGQVAAGEYTVDFDQDRLSYTTADYIYHYDGLDNITFNDYFSLPFKTVYIKVSDYNSTNNVAIASCTTTDLGSIPHYLSKVRDKFTGFESVPGMMSTYKRDEITSPIYDIQKFTKDNEIYIAVTLLPVVVSSENEVLFYNEINLQIDNMLHESDRIEVAELLDQSSTDNRVNRTSSSENLALGLDYVIITNDALADEFQRLADFRSATGLSAGVVTVQEIYDSYSGIDEQAMIKEYLKDFYNSGGEYVLFGGDNTVVPVRYVYYYNASTPPSDPYYLMPSDLYYSDLDGDWNADGDEIYGEPTDDSPNITPELYTGRLPVMTVEAAAAYIDKIIAYETNPGNGDFAYLGKSLFFASDEMRDFQSVGQHNMIADELPVQIEVDSSSTVELPSGDDPNPYNEPGIDAVQKINEGSGFIHIIAHGRIDGFVVRSANYGDWPASYILTQPQSNDIGSTDDLEPNNKTSLYYSLSCNVGGFDMDSLNGVPSDRSLAERLISADSAGAVAFIANSRWGWVYSSYQLEKAFTQYLYTTADGSPVKAMYQSWTYYPYSRDLIYGQFYFGDPALKIYTDIQQPMHVQLNNNCGGDDLCSSVNFSAVPYAQINISLNGELIESGYTDGNGQYTIQTQLIEGKEYTVTARKEGYTLFYDTFIASITLAVDDDDNGLFPDEFKLDQNYPNPFNPTTVIGYSLPVRSDVTIEIYNLLGQNIASFEFVDQSSGQHELTWDAEDRYGSSLPTGVYFYRMTAENFRETKKMMLIR